MKSVFTLVILLFSGNLLFAQAGNPPSILITGKIQDSQSNPVPFGNAAVYSQKDSALVSGAVSAENGTFEVRIKPGAYFLKITSLSFEEKHIPELLVKDKDINLGSIILKSGDKLLEEVVIKGEKSQMELSLDKRVFNVGQDLASAGGTATDILRNVPSVAVDVEGNISLRGSNSVRILIDGKPSALVSNGGRGLEQLQAGSIERIEVITNPSARYEAEGMSGIINIVLKKERKEGINGSFDLIAGYPANYGAAANVNYRRKNLNFFINYSASYRNVPGRNSLYQEFYKNDTTTLITVQNSTHSLNGQYNNARGGLDYYFNEKNVLTASYTWRISKGKRYSEFIYRDYLNSINNPEGITNRTQDETESEPNSEYALTYKKSFAREGHELTADVRYIDNRESSDQTFTERTDKQDDGGSDIRDLLQKSLNDETEKQFLVTLDYIHPFGKEGKFETGLRSSTRDMNNDYSVTEENENGSWSPLDSLTNIFLYEENIHAIYGIYSNKIRKLSYQGGLRAEWTGVTTSLLLTNEINPRNYGNLFPSAHITYELPNDNALQLSYSRRVRRPQYNDLSPFMTYSDRRNYFSGNPDLNPEFSDAFEAGHIKHLKNGSLSSSLYYRHTTGKIVRIRTIDEFGFTRYMPENLAFENSYGAEFMVSYNPYKWWRLDGSLNIFRAVTDGSNLDDELKSDTYSGISRLSSRFTFWEKVDFQLRGNYMAPEKLPQGSRKSVSTLDLAANRDVLKGKGTITLTVTDLFNSRRFRTITEGANFYTELNSQGRLRQINLTFNYRLNQKKKTTKEGLESEF